MPWRPGATALFTGLAGCRRRSIVAPFPRPVDLVGVLTQ
jgi:hypothetical protein